MEVRADGCSYFKCLRAEVTYWWGFARLIGGIFNKQNTSLPRASISFLIVDPVWSMLEALDHMS